VILAGSGVRAAHATAEFDAVIQRLGIPVTTAWTHDLIASDDPLFCGRPGTIGTRAGNFTVQNADLLLILGSRLNVRQVSYNWQAFAPQAFKIQVDIDQAELNKPTVKPDLAIVADLKHFLTAFAKTLDDWRPTATHQAWLAWCKQRLLDYPNVLPRTARNGRRYDQPLPLHRNTLRATSKRRHRRLRQRHGDHRSLSGGSDQARHAHVFELGQCVDGLRPARCDRCVFRCARWP
jgi:acetolactate synthase-1/2/3 large subunit